MCVLNTPSKLRHQWDAPSKTRPGPSSRLTSKLMAPAWGWPEGGMREVAQNYENVRSAHLVGSRMRSTKPRHELCWAARRKR